MHLPAQGFCKQLLHATCCLLLQALEESELTDIKEGLGECRAADVVFPRVLSVEAYSWLLRVEGDDMLSPSLLHGSAVIRASTGIPSQRAAHCCRQAGQGGSGAVR